jgi:hypothetical protein
MKTTELTTLAEWESPSVEWEVAAGRFVAKGADRDEKLRLKQISMRVTMTVRSLRRLAEEGLSGVRAIGDDLNAAKKLVEHGRWGDYLSHLDISEKTATNYMRIAKNWERLLKSPRGLEKEIGNVADLTEGLSLRKCLARLATEDKLQKKQQPEPEIPIPVDPEALARAQEAQAERELKVEPGSMTSEQIEAESTKKILAELRRYVNFLDRRTFTSEQITSLCKIRDQINAVIEARS